MPGLNGAKKDRVDRVNVIQAACSMWTGQGLKVYRMQSPESQFLHMFTSWAQPRGVRYAKSLSIQYFIDIDIL